MATQPCLVVDEGFLRLAAEDPRLPMVLLGRVMGAIPLTQSLSFISEAQPYSPNLVEGEFSEV